MTARRSRRRLTAADVWPEDDAIAHVSERLEALRRLLPCDRREMREARPDYWPDDRTGNRRLGKDITRVGAVWREGAWHLPERVEPESDPRIADPDAVRRARRLAREGRHVFATDALAVLASLDAALSPVERGARTEGARQLAEWLEREGLSLRQAAARLGVKHVAVSHWRAARRRPVGSTRRTLQASAGIDPGAWDRPERALTGGVNGEDER